MVVVVEFVVCRHFLGSYEGWEGELAAHLSLSSSTVALSQTK